MRISALRLFNVRRFAGRGVAIEGIDGGVNVLCAANEVGKSTSFEALHALFFQPHSSMSKEVKDLRPYGGGSPIVEADIATDAGRFRLVKQYYGGRAARVTDLGSGRIVAQSDEAEAFIAGLIGGGAAGPAGLLWVRQGITSLEKRSRSEDESEKQVRASLLESVQGEVEAITGGRRMAEIMLAVRDELSVLVTPSGKAKAGGRYLSAIEERDRLAAEHGRLEHEVTTLRSALEKRSAAEKRLAEREDPEERRAGLAAIAATEAACESARAQAGLLKTAEAELALAGDRRDAGERELRTFTAAMSTSRDLRGRLREAESRRSEAIARRETTAASIGAAAAHEEAAEAEERAARTLLDRLDAAAAARAASERRAGLEERLREAEILRQAIEDGEARFALLKLPANAIDQLQALDVEIARRRAMEQAARPSVAISYEPASPGLVSMDGTPLRSGEPRSYANEATLSVPGVGTIMLRSNRPLSDDYGLERAEARRRTLLASLGVDDLAAARDREARAREAEEALREQRGRLSLLAADGLQKLREDVAACGAIDLDALELKENPGEVRANLAKAHERRKTARQTLRELEPQRKASDEAFVVAETGLASLRAELVQVEAALGTEIERADHARGLMATLEDLQRRFDTAQALAKGLRLTAVDLEAAEARRRRARSVEAAAEKEINELREEIAGLNGEIRMRADDAVEETWRETAEALAAAQTRVRGFEQEVAVLRRLSSALEAARIEARELYLKPVMTELEPLLGLLFDDVGVSFDDRTLLPDVIRRNGQEEDVERLSGGMREQLSVLTRLAFARLLARDGRPAPVILDDALVYSDDDRIEKMFDVLHRQSSGQQIIVFSCRQRAFQKLGGTVLRMTEWQP